MTRLSLLSVCLSVCLSVQKIKERVDPLVARQTLLRERQSSSPPQTQDSNVRAGAGMMVKVMVMAKQVATIYERWCKSLAIFVRG